MIHYWQKDFFMKTCKHCNKNFESKTKRVFCDSQCRIDFYIKKEKDKFKEFVNAERESASRICCNCNSSFLTYFYGSNRQKFCSSECKTEWHKSVKRKNNQEKLECSNRSRTCNHCDNVFEIQCGRNILDQKFCSSLCKKNFHKTQLKLKTKEIRQTIIKCCPICEKSFTPKKTLKQVYCSRRCCYLFPKKAYGMLDRCLKQIGTSKEKHAHEVLGFTPLELQRHVQNHPDWNEISKGDWHLDHIIPIIAFIEHGIKDIKLMCCLENLQPLKSIDNIKKNKNYDKDEFKKWISNLHGEKQ